MADLQQPEQYDKLDQRYLVFSLERNGERERIVLRDTRTGEEVDRKAYEKRYG